MNISKESFNQELIEMANPQQIEKKFGGMSSDKIKNFFPPREVSANYGYDKTRLEEIKKRMGSLKTNPFVH